MKEEPLPRTRLDDYLDRITVPKKYHGMGAVKILAEFRKKKIITPFSKKRKTTLQ